jgi:apolipoprotein N-acyltransferase
MVMILLTSALLVYVIKNAESIHLPYLVAVFSAISIGFAEPYKGWLLAILQCMLLLAGYFLLTTLPEGQARQELENFSLYGSVILTFVASFLGGFLKRALNMK